MKYFLLAEFLEEAETIDFSQEQSCRVIDCIEGNDVKVEFQSFPVQNISSQYYNRYETPVVLFEPLNLIRYTYCVANKRIPVYVRKHIRAFRFKGFNKGVAIWELLTQISELLSYNNKCYERDDSITVDDNFRKRAIENLLRFRICVEEISQLSTLQLGAVLNNGRYTIKKVLGNGGFAITYLATDGNLQNKEVVIKELFMREYCMRNMQTYDVVVRPSCDADKLLKVAIAKFVGEAEKIKDVVHPNIIKVFDVFSEHNTHYYTMEYFPNGSLEDLLSKGEITEENAVKYIKCVANGLAKMHSMNMAHLDIKPANIMLNDDDEAVIIDFGSTKRYDSLGMECTGNPLVLSNRFAAPELFTNKHLTQFSPKADVYSLGAMLFVMLTKRLPVDYRRTKGLSNKIKKVIRCATAKFNYRINNIDEFLALLNE